MRNYFLQVKAFIEQNFEEINWTISGVNYPPPPLSQVIAQVTGYVWIIGIVLVMFGSNIFKTLGITEPSFMKVINENKMMAFIGLFMVNSYGNGLLATGAFEVTLDGELVFSKLQSGKLPTGSDLISIIENSLKSQ